MNILSTSLFHSHSWGKRECCLCARPPMLLDGSFAPCDHSPRRLSYLLLPDGQLLLFILVVQRQVLMRFHEYSIPLHATVRLLSARKVNIIYSPL